MGLTAMKKKLERIQRWLDRLKTAYEKGRLESAVQEADCLSAEVRETRDCLWKMLEGTQPSCEHTNKLHKILSIGAQSTGIAFAVILVSTLPLAVEQDRSFVSSNTTQKEISQNANKIAVIADGDYLYNKLRKKIGNRHVRQLSVENIGMLQTKANPAEAVVRHVAISREAPKHEHSATIVNSRRDNAETARNVVTNEELMALVQVGEKAIRGSSSAIKVVDNR